jgi:predicted amidophosphoribosyltransferase
LTEQEIKDRIANNLCLECGKPLTDGLKLFCKDCLGKSKEHFSQKVFGREYKEEDNWTWVFGLMMVASLFGFGGDKDNDGN